MNISDIGETVRDGSGRAWNPYCTARRPQLDVGMFSGYDLQFYVTDAGFVFELRHNTEPQLGLVRGNKSRVVKGEVYLRTSGGVEVRESDITFHDDGTESLNYPVEVLQTQGRRTDAFIKDLVTHLGLDYWERSVLQAIDTDSHFDGAAYHYDRVSKALSGLALVYARMASNTAASDAVRLLATFKSDGSDVPFFSEENLYEVVGKDDARSLLALIGMLTPSPRINPGDS